MRENLGVVMQHWGNRLSETLERRGYQKSAAIAYVLGVNESTVSRWKGGGKISMSHAIELCQFLNVSMDWLFLGEDFEFASYPASDALVLARLARDLKTQPRDVVNALANLITVIAKS